MAKAGRQLGKAMRVLCALAVLLLSFSHQSVLARQIAPQIAADYMLPDGTIGDICFGQQGVDDHNPSHEGWASICDYCRLAASAVLPQPPDDGYLVFHTVALSKRSPAFLTVAVRQPRALPQSRAPPFLR